MSTVKIDAKVGRVLLALNAMHEQNASAFDQLAKWLDEENRPAYGSVTLNFAEGELRFVTVAGTYK